MNIIPVIMAGGTGSRLWPMSREHYPKQYLNLHGEKSMLQETLLRLSGLSCDTPLVICNEQHRFLVAEQLRQLSLLDKNIILEPFGRNTAPAITLAAINAIETNYDEDSLLLVLAADHVINDTQSFHDAINNAIDFASEGNLATFGIVPKVPETGYGYILRGDIKSINNSTGFNVQSFVEKPDLPTAQAYIESGEYYWNSGMFLFSAKTYLAQIQKYCPEIFDACHKAMEMKNSDSEQEFIRVNSDLFMNCPSESIDYAVMEKTKDAVVIPLDAGWNDVGSWSALWDVNDKDIDGNVLMGDVLSFDSKNCYVNSEENLVATVGVEDIIIVNTKDATLVINKNKVQDVKKIVEHLKSAGRKEFSIHRETYKPWGHVDKIVSKNRYNINKLTVKPGQSISLQKHHHRTEHWIVLSGTAQVILNGDNFLLTENQSTFIPIGASHELNNPGKIPLEILEIQSGDYLEADDIVRFSQDSYF